MARKGLTEIVCIIDKSGSMNKICDDAIGGFNAFLEEQKAEEGDALLSLTLFDSGFQRVWDGEPIDEVPPLDESTYRPGGRTALLDAFGQTIIDVYGRIESTPEDERPEQVAFVILTDGRENSSENFTEDLLSDLVGAFRKRGWEFIFLGANIDAFEVASRYNIDSSRVTQFESSGRSVDRTYRSASTSISVIRQTGAPKKPGTSPSDQDT